MPGSVKSRKGKKDKTKFDFPILPLKEILNPYPDVPKNRKARGTILSKITQKSPRRLRAKLNLRTKTVRTEDVDDFLLTIHNETFHPNLVVTPADGTDEGPRYLCNVYRLKELSTKQHYDIITRLRKQIRKERQLCGTFAEEKKIFFQELGLAQNRLACSRKRLELTERELNQENEEFRNNLMVSKQKLKHLMSEQYTGSFLAKTDVLEKFVPTHRETWSQEQAVYEGPMKIKQKEAIDRTILDQLLREVRLSRVRENDVDRENFLTIQETMSEVFNTFVEETRKETEDKLKERVLSLYNTKNAQVNHMLEVQAKALNNLRNYYQDIVSSNADMIVDLKEQVDSRRSKLDRLEKSIYHALEELNRYQGLLQIVEDDIAKCKKILERAPVIHEQNAKRHQQRRLLAEDVKRHRWMKEVETTRIQKSEEDLEGLNRAFFETKFEIFQKAALSDLLHSKAWTLLSEEAAMYQLSYHILQGMSQSSPTTSLENDHAVQKILQEQDKEIQRLQAHGISIRQKHEMLWKGIKLLFEEEMKSSMDARFGFYQPKMDVVFSEMRHFFDEKCLLPELDSSSDKGAGINVLENMRSLRFEKNDRSLLSIDKFRPANNIKAAMYWDTEYTQNTCITSTRTRSEYFDSLDSATYVPVRPDSGIFPIIST